MAAPEFKYNMDTLRQEALDLAELCKNTRDLFASVQHGMDAQYKCEDLRQDMLKIKRMLDNMSGCWPVICKSYSGSILPTEAALHEDTAQPSSEPAAATGFPTVTAIGDLGPESPEHAAVREAISSNADEATIKKAKAAFVDSILRKAERNKDAYGVSDFNADDPMSFIRYLMKKVSLLESRCGRLEAALASIKDSVKRVSDIKAAPVSRHESVLDRKIRAWFDGMENHLPDDDDPWWQLPPPPGY